MVSFKINLPKYLIYIAIAPTAEIGGSTTKAHHVFTTQKCKISTLILFRLYLNELNFF